MTRAATYEAVDAWTAYYLGEKAARNQAQMPGVRRRSIWEKGRAARVGKTSGCFAVERLSAWAVERLGAWALGRLGGLPGYRTMVTQSDSTGGAFSPAVASYRLARGPLVHQV